MSAGDTELYVTQKKWDSNLVEGKPSFTTTIGASNISLIPNNAQAYTNQNLTYTVTPPSINVVMRRAPLHDITLTFGVLLVQSDGSNVNGNSYVCMDPNGVPFGEIGRHIAVASPAPVSQLASNVQINLNNVSVQAQNQYFNGISQVLEGPHSRADHGVTYRNPVTASWDDAADTLWGLNAATGEMQGVGDVGPGGFNVQYTDATGALLPYSSTIQYLNEKGVDIGALSPRGDPTTLPAAGGIPPVYGIDPDVQKFYTAYQYGRPITHPLGAGVAHWVFFRQRFIDPVQVQPFSFNEKESQDEVGMYGISSMTFQFQLATASSVRLVQNCTNDGCIMLSGLAPVTGVVLPPGAAVAQSGDLIPTNGVSSARLWTYYLSQPLNTPLPPRSIVPYTNIQFWQQKTDTTDIPAGGVTGGQGDLFNNGKAMGASYKSVIVNFNSITLGNIPSKLFIWCAPTLGPSCGVRPSETNWMCTYPDNPFQQFIFANQAGIYSGWPTCQFISQNRANGAKASIQQQGGYEGLGKCMFSGMPTFPGGTVMVIEPGKDFQLPALTAAGSAGQVQISFSITVNVPVWGTGRSITTTVMAASPGFFCTQAGISRQVNIGLDQKAVDEAKLVDFHGGMEKHSQALGLSGGAPLLSVPSTDNPKYHSASMSSNMQQLMPPSRTSSSNSSYAGSKRGAQSLAEALAD